MGTTNSETMDTIQADKVITDVVSVVDIDWYKGYAGSIMPRSHEDLFRRWLFAYASVHTTWELNCVLYKMLADFDAWLGDADKLKGIIIDSRAGLFNNRTKYIMEFAREFWCKPEWFWKRDDETWTAYRDRIKESALGIGPAKSSFVVEMTYPVESAVVCTDTHFMQTYGIKPGEVGKVKGPVEAAMEAHWVERCQALGVPPVLVRWAAWDVKQRRSNPRYWTHVLEPRIENLVLESVAAA